MTEEEKQKRKAINEQKARFAGPTRPSMLRRSDYHDYTDRRMYLITMTTDGRRPLLGHLEGSTEEAHVVPSAVGAAVIRQWNGIAEFYPQIRIIATCLMPDHFHGILFVSAQLPVHLGVVIRGFKQGCTKEYRQIAAMNGGPQQPFLPQQPCLPQQPNSQQQPTGTIKPVGRVVVGCDSSQQQPPSLWSSGYNDRILKERGQLDRWIAYLKDNPRRLAMKRAHPELFRVTTALPLLGTTFSSLGNLFLLNKPERVQVQCSRSLTPAQIEERKAFFLKLAAEGAVIVSPSISDGERAIVEAVYEAGYPLILLMKKGFHELQKPPKHFFDACAEGRLLWLSPFAYSNRPVPLYREMCLQLNEFARRICEEL